MLNSEAINSTAKQAFCTHKWTFL